MKVEVAVLGSSSLIVLVIIMVSACGRKATLNCRSQLRQKLCESRGGRADDVGRNGLRCRADILGTSGRPGPLIIVRMVSADFKQR